MSSPQWGHVAEWLRNGLQNRVHQFNSGRGLHPNPILIRGRSWNRRCASLVLAIDRAQSWETWIGEVFRILVTGGPPNFGGGGAPSISIDFQISSVGFDNRGIIDVEKAINELFSGGISKDAPQHHLPAPRKHKFV
jgi:hypothetical protein